MENTIENKRKFFAQYWGQEVQTYPYYEKLTKELVNPIFCNNAVLELTPLSSITYEDAIEVGKFFASANGFPNDNNFTKNDVIEMLNDCPIIPYQCIDYLRSKKYAFNYMGLSVEQLIEYGWIKLKTE